MMRSIVVAVVLAVTSTFVGPAEALPVGDAPACVAAGPVLGQNICGFAAAAGEVIGVECYQGVVMLVDDARNVVLACSASSAPTSRTGISDGRMLWCQAFLPTALSAPVAVGTCSHGRVI